MVGADPQQGKGRGVVSTASYEARPYGVHSAMPISQAYRLCPHAIYLRPNISLYSQYSKQVFQVLEHFTPAVQAVSIDEAFMDVGGTVHIYGSAWKLGTEIKKQIYEETQLTASVGIAPGKSVAKIASDFQKPDGLVVVNVNEVQQFLEALPVTKLWGVGKKTFETLSKLGINTVKQLREFRLEWLEQSFGKLGHHLYQIARGIDDREVTTREEIKSVSHETTFEIDQTDPEVLLSTLLSLSEKVSSRLRKYGL
ncbi:MAG: DNA polymerase IV, partial [Aliifodinibius sp.]|nr:DNA polymerase IV [Fodinibius sp.]